MIVAHRGFPSQDGENRMVDFKNALKFCKGVEFDIRMTKDQKVIIFHDYDFKRIGKLDKTVRELTYEEIKKISFFKNNPTSLPALFTDFIDEISEQYELINIEIKPAHYNNVDMKEIYKQLNLLKEKTTAEIIVSSFNKKILEWIANLNDNFKKGYLILKTSDIDFLLIKKFNYINPSVTLLEDKTNYQIFKKINLPMNVWAIKTNDDLKLTKEYEDLIHSYISDTADLDLKNVKKNTKNLTFFQQ